MRKTNYLLIVLTSILLAYFTNISFVDAQATKGSTGTGTKTENFDNDPGWVGVNFRSAQSGTPRTIRQDFGFSPNTHHAGGRSPGEIGGYVSPAGEAAFYAKSLPELTLDQPLTASGTLSLDKGGTNILLGFFNDKTINEWRTPNSLALRINGRGDKFFAYVEYCTSKWKAGGDTTPFPTEIDPKTKRIQLIGFPCETRLSWSLSYAPNANQGRGVIFATIGTATAKCELDESHKADGATFNRFGILNVIKSADSGSNVWLDDITINDAMAERFDTDPNWDQSHNHLTYTTRNVRPWFDFGFSETHFAGGKNPGELGGQIFRGDCRYPERLACYGDHVGPLTLNKPIKASGKISLVRGVTDSTTLFGFYNSKDSMRVSEEQNDGLPESTLGIHIEGPSRDGFRFYPVLREKGQSGKFAKLGSCPTIYPNGKSHDWSLEYAPRGASGHGTIKVTLDDSSHTMELSAEATNSKTTFDRFGIVTSWIDGNGQSVYWDDLTYTNSQP